MEKNLLEFSGRRSKTIITLVHCDDGSWRYMNQLDLHDKMNTFSGYCGCLNHDEAYEARDDALAAAVLDLCDRIEEEDRNPKACAEALQWLISLGAVRRQLSLF
jgi:hypothetical protein